MYPLASDAHECLVYRSYKLQALKGTETKAIQIENEKIVVNEKEFSLFAL